MEARSWLHFTIVSSAVKVWFTIRHFSLVTCFDFLTLKASFWALFLYLILSRYQMSLLMSQSSTLSAVIVNYVDDLSFIEPQGWLNSLLLYQSIFQESIYFEYDYYCRDLIILYLGAKFSLHSAWDCLLIFDYKENGLMEYFNLAVIKE